MTVRVLPLVIIAAVGTALAVAPAPTAGTSTSTDPPGNGVRAPSSIAPASSVDRALLAFQSRADGDYEIYLARPDGSGRRQLTRNGVDDKLPDWSPDGRQLLFLRGTAEGVGSYYVMTADGRGAWRLGRGVSPYEWSPDGRRLAFTERDRPGLSVVNADGSKKRRIYRNEPLGFEWSPDGTKLVFGCNRDLCTSGTDGRLRRVSRNGVYPDWSPDGRRIAFLRPAGDLYGVFVMRADGKAVKRLFPVRVSRYSEWGWSPDGRRLAIEDDDRIGVVNADGTEFRWIHQQEDSLGFATSWSPDGRNIAFDCGPVLLGDVCVANVATDSVRNLTDTEDRGEGSGAWSPDGKMIAFLAHGPDPRVENDDTGMFVVKADGGRPLRLTQHRGDISWSPDGRWISFWGDSSTSPNLYVVSADGRRLTRIARLALRESWRPQPRRG